MSIHKSLKKKNSLVGTRSVLSRWERLVKLTDDGRWKTGDDVTGLPKVRTHWRARKRKKEAAAPVAGAVAGAPAAGAPAAGGAKAAAPAAGAKAAPAAGGAKPAAAAPAAPKKK
jgi:small basic protein (TIGR04137 family)